MKRPLIMICALGLAGCSTTMAELETHPVRATFASARPMSALEPCFASALSWMGLPSIVRGEERTAMTFGAAGQAIFMLTMEPAEGGTSIAVRQQVKFADRARRNIEGCV